jgi:GntR family transcriptional regulator/MocR family aminotransferase
MIAIDHGSSTPLYRQIYEQIRSLIMDGSYPAGSKLPPIRKLGEELTISRNTVEAAYLQLSSEGYVNSRTGSGFTVETLDLRPELPVARVSESSENFKTRLAQTGLWDEPETGFSKKLSRSSTAIVGDIKGSGDDSLALVSTSSIPEISYDFTYGNLEGLSFPAQIWRRLATEVLLGSEADQASVYNDGLGERELRVQIANYLKINAGVHCHPAQIVIQAGTQSSLQNLLTLFDPLRDVIAMEEPGYSGVRAVFENNRFRLFPVPVYQGGGAFIDALYNSHSRLAYCTPSNQFPTGKILSLSARQQLLKWASEQNAFIIEDDYCREYRYNTGPLPSLQSLDHGDRVIYMGTFSKSLSPALRINYLVLPPELLFEWNRHFENYYSAVPWLSQAVLAKYMQEGFWEKRLRKMQAINKHKYLALKGSLEHYMDKKVDIFENGSGLHLLVGDRQRRHQNELIELAAKQGVKVYGTQQYWMSERHPMENFVLIGFSAIAKNDIAPGIAALDRAWYGD